MTQSRHIRTYNHLSAEDRRTFDRWIRVNAVFGVLGIAALIAMAVVGSGSSELVSLAAQPEQVLAQQSR